MKNKIALMSFEEYLKSDGLSQSQLKYLAKTPSTFKYYVLDGNERKETEALIIGRAFHTFILEPKVFTQQYFIGDKITRRGKAWEDMKIAANGKEIIWTEDIEEFKKMQNGLDSNFNIARFLNDYEPEISMFWESNGEKCKGRIDAVKKCGDKVALIDLKTTRDIDKFIPQIFSSKYHMQAAYYMDGYEAITAVKPARFDFIAIDKAPPYLCGLYSLSDEAIKVGRQEYQNLLKLYKHCKVLGEWGNGKYDEAIMANVPPWYQQSIGESNEIIY